MSKIEILMWCLAYALDMNPGITEIRRAKDELLNIRQSSVDKVLKSIEFYLPHMSRHEIALFHRQFCTCILSAVSYWITLQVHDRISSGYSACPRCGAPLSRDYQAYCDCCGQHLSWVKHAPSPKLASSEKVQWFSNLWQAARVDSDGC